MSGKPSLHKRLSRTSNKTEDCGSLALCSPLFLKSNATCIEAVFLPVLKEYR
ncbi:unknown [Prevotella sp. CAG:924]|nr:unknown [Prevotella sp. CAG:924]